MHGGRGGGDPEDSVRELKNPSFLGLHRLQWVSKGILQSKISQLPYLVLLSFWLPETISQPQLLESFKFQHQCPPSSLVRFKFGL